MKADYDVAICGGGNAGLLLSRHLQLTQPERSVLLLDAAGAPSPEPCHKIGESIPEGSAYYLRHTLRLGEHLFHRQIPKFGLRFFFGGGTGMRFADRLEFGGTQWPPVPTFQLDRGRFENDLRAMVGAGGTRVLTEARVLDIELNGERPHRVSFRHRGGDASCTARWVIDASGRRRLLAGKLGLTIATPHRASASWMRLDARIDVDGLVPRRERAWHERTGPPRFYSTVHLAGDHYWVWVINLPGERTSVGVVACENAHPVAARGNRDRMLAWLRRHEPELAGLVSRAPILDCRFVRDFAYGTRRAFSPQRWALLGDAAAFADPLYSPGQELISHGCSMVEHMVGADFAGRFTPELCERYERLYQKLFAVVLDQYVGCYKLLGRPFLFTHKLAWDSSLYFSILQQTLSQNIYEAEDGPAALEAVLDELVTANRRMQARFVAAADRPDPDPVYQGMRTWAPRVARFADAAVEKVSAAGFSAFYTERLAELDGIGEVLSANLSSGAGEAAEARAPAEWDGRERIAAERRGFRPVAGMMLSGARRLGEAVAIDAVQGPLSYAALSRRIRTRARALAATEYDWTRIDPEAAEDALVTMLASASIRRPFALVTQAGSADADSLRGLAAPHNRCRSRDVAFRRIASGPAAPPTADHDQASWWRMTDWLVRLLGGPAVAPGRRCLWLGPISEEGVVPLLLGARLRLCAEPDEPSPLVFGQPRALAKLGGAPWLAQATVVAIGDTLPPPLRARLSNQTGRLLDFGYAVFAH